VPSKDFLRIMKILDDSYKVTSIQVTLSEPPKIVIDFSKDSLTKTISSTEEKAFWLAVSMKSAVNEKGDSCFGIYRNREEFDKTIRYLADPQRIEIPAAEKRLQEASLKIDYVPAELISTFLDSKNKYNKKFSKLKENYYEIYVLSIIHLQEINNAYEDYRKKSTSTPIYDLTSELFRIYQSDDIPLRRSRKYLYYCGFDISFLVSQIKPSLDNLLHQRDMLAKAGGMPAEIGLHYILEEYLSFSEPITRFLNPIRAAVELSEGVQNPERKYDIVKNWEIIRKHPKYGEIVKDFDPRIRHAKAHGNIVINKDTHKLEIYADKNGKAVKVTEYTWDEFRTMYHRLCLMLPALVMLMYMQNLVMTELVILSSEYKIMIAGIDNLKRLV